MGVLQHSLTLYPREGQTREVLKWTGWNLRYEAKSMSPFDECLTPNHNFLMNIVIWVYKKKKKKIIIWNWKGALKPSFQSRVRELV